METCTGAFESAGIGLLLFFMRDTYPDALESAGRGLTYPGIF